jgi:Tfp pilus assembly protein PilN
MAHRLNLARRPFVDARPANVSVAALGLLLLGLSVWSVRTVVRYLSDSARTRAAIVSLREEIDGLEEQRRAAESRLGRYDIGELDAETEDANQLALRRSFSWTRFLTRLEKTLPADARVASVALARGQKETPGARRGPGEMVNVELVLISRSPDGMSRAIRSFYGSKWFDHPRPHSEDRGERGPAEGRRIVLGVTYRDVEEAR